MMKTTMQQLMEVDVMVREKLIDKKKRQSPYWKSMTRQMDKMAGDEKATDKQYDELHEKRFKKEEEIRAYVLKMDLTDVIREL